MPCRFNRRRMWTHRIMLEANEKEDNCFVTLTYADEHLPRTFNGKETLEPKHLQDWLKRFRATINPIKIRYFAVGEYGDRTFRPHYHLALFGWPECRHGFSRYTKRRQSCCASCDTILDSWGLGQIAVGSLEASSAQYVAGYVTKKMTFSDDPRLEGRNPEFARMSLRPGIGTFFMHDVASEMLKFNLDQTQADVPSALRHGSRTLPLGRHLRRKLREALGKDGDASIYEKIKYQEEMRPLLEAAKNDPDNPSLRAQVLKANKQAVLNMTARNALKGKKDKL